MVRFDFDRVFGDDYLYFYAPAFTEERNRAEAEEIVETLGLRAGDRVLDAPCGHGRIAGVLAERGCIVTGVDNSAAFLAVAREEARRNDTDITYLEGDVRSLPTDGPFDAVICWFTSFGFFDDNDNRQVLAEYRRVLAPGGRLLIETMHHDGFIRSVLAVPPPSTYVVREGDDLLMDETTFDPVAGRVETDRTTVRAGRVADAHFSVRLPTPPEFLMWLTACGFADVTFSDRRGEPLTVQSRRLVVVAR